MSPTSRSDPMTGVVLDGRYRVDGLIATGGMSAVYRGLDTRLDRPVALKVMDARYAGDAQFLTRFQREARAVARLKHPGLVAVYDQGIDTSAGVGDAGAAGHPFLVMELVEGGTLRELLRERGPMPPHAVAAVLAPVLGGLAEAHRAGLVHRDVKPENVLISDDGEVKIADFGLVRAVAEAKITSTSVILGTADYLSPEQVGTGDADARSDVYAAGVLAYELLTGATPFTGDSALSIAYRRMTEDVPAPGAAIVGVPRQFDQLIARATARDPAGRHRDAAELGADLQAIAAELGLPAFRVPAPRHSAQHRASAAMRASAGGAVGAVAPGGPFGGPPDGLATEPHPPRPPADLPQLDPAVPPRRPTRTLTRGPGDWAPGEWGSGDRQAGDWAGNGWGGQWAADDAAAPRASLFAGIDIDEFEWARQRARRTSLFWLVGLLTLTALVAVGAWTLGQHLTALL